MATLADFRKRYPMYDDIPDAELADKLHRKFYSDIPREEFNQRIGLAPGPDQQQPGGRKWAGLMAEAKNLITGELDIDPEFANAPEFHKAILANQPKDLSDVGEFDLTAISRSAVTPDPKAQLDILRKNIPGLETKTDRNGNILLRAPKFGVTEWAYLNRPGASARDLDELGTQTLATLPLAGLFGAGASIPARIGAGALAGGAGSVVQDVAAMTAGSEQGIDLDRAAISAAAGGALAPLGGKVTPRVPAPHQGAKPGETPLREETLRAAERINANILPKDEPLAVPLAVASDAKAVQTVAGGLGTLPVVGGPLQKAAQEMTSQLGKATDEVAAQFGGGAAASPFSAGSAAKDALTDWIKRGYRVATEEGYQELDKLIRQDTRIPLTNTQRVANELTDLDRISASTDGQRVIALVEEAITRPEGLNYRGLKELRTRVGERLFGDIAPEAGTSARALDRIYAALSEDLRAVVRRGGIEKSGSSGRKALEAFEQANRKAAEIAEKRKLLKRIVGAEADAPAERVFDRLIQMAGPKGNADINRLVEAQRVIGPESWGEVASAVIARLGRDRDGNFSPARFLTDYGKLSESGKDILFGGHVGLKEALEDIATVSKKFEATLSKYGNPSGTGRAVATFGGIGTAIASPFHALASAIGGWTLAKLLARPATAKQVATYAKARLAVLGNPTTQRLQALNAAERALSASIARLNAGQPESEPSAKIGPWQTTVRPDLANNETYRVLVSRGIPPEEAAAAIGTPRAIELLQLTAPGAR